MKKNLRYKDLRYKNLRYKNLRYKDLRYKNLRYKNLRYKNLRYKNLRYKHTLNMLQLILYNIANVKVRVKQSHYRPGQALRVPGVWSFQISRQSAHEGGKVVSPKHRPPLPPKIFLVFIFLTGWVDPRVIVRPEGLCQWKNSFKPSGIEPAAFWLLAQCLKYVCHHVPLYIIALYIYIYIYMRQWYLYMHKYISYLLHPWKGKVSVKFHIS